MKTLIISLLFFYVSAQNINISNGLFWQGEPFIIQNKKYPNNLIIAWMGYYFPAGSNTIAIRIVSSQDFGNTWSSPTFIPHVVSNYTSADPTMASDTLGNIHLAFIDYNKDSSLGAIYYTKSSDFGQTWTQPVEVINSNSDPGENPIDRPWISVSPDGKNIFITSLSIQGTPTPNRPYVSISTDYGQTFSWRYIDTTNFSVGNVIAQPMPTPVNFQDTFKIAYPSYDIAQNLYPQFFLATTKNYGQSFSYNTIFKGGQFSPNDSTKSSYKLFQDPTDNNHLIFVFRYEKFGDTDIFFTESNDNGNTWSNIARVNDDPVGNGVIQDMFWGEFDTDGDFVLTWRDRRNGTPNTAASDYEFYAAVKSKNDTTFGKNFVISDSLISYDPKIILSGNDFMSCAFYNDTLYATWGDTRTGNLQIWFSKHFINTTSGIKSKPKINILVFPNPTTKKCTIKLPYGVKNIRIYSAEGKLIKEVSENSFNISTPGLYELEITDKRGNRFRRKLIVVGE